MKSSHTSSIKSTGAKTTGAIRSATRSSSGNTRAGKVNFMSVSKNTSDSKAKDENGNEVKSSNQKNSSDNGEYSKEKIGNNFATRLTQSNDKLAFSRVARLTKQGLGPGAFASSSSSSGLGGTPLPSPSWSGTGAVASSLAPQGNNSGLLGFGNGGSSPNISRGTAKLSPEDLNLLEGGKGDGNFSVVNSTVSSKVSWMTNNGNYLTQHLRDEVNSGKSIGEVFNQVHGKNVGGNSQTLNINGNKLDNSFGKEGNKASHAVFLADLTHNRHGGMFKADSENFRSIALASGVPADKIKVVNNWADYKAEITKAAQEAKSIKASDGDEAQLGLLTGTAAHGYSFGGRGVQDENATSGFSVWGQDVKEKQIEDLVGMADAHFNNTLMINCPCHSGGFDGKTNLLAEGKLDGVNKELENDPSKPKEENTNPEKIA